MNPIIHAFKRAANPFFKSLGYEFIRVKDKVQHDYLYPLQAIIDDYVGRNLNRNYFFIQIGANDGVSCAGFTEVVKDLLCSDMVTWNGVFVEPIPWAMAKLQKRYAGRPGLHYEEAAIAEQDGYAKFFLPNDDKLSVAASLDEQQVKWATADKPCVVGSIRVKTMTMDSLFKKYNRPVDFLCIDAEGYDGRLLTSLLTAAPFRPAIIQFEHLWMELDEYRRIIALLRGAGYKTLPVNIDTLCVLQKP